MTDPYKPKVTIQKTTVLMYDQGYTYNESGFSYNESGVAYGGLYGYNTVQINPTIVAKVPFIVSGINVSGTVLPHERELGAGMMIGMLGMTYPTTGTVIV